MVHRPNVDSCLCFVLMPFRADFQEYYTDIIRPAVEQVGLHAIRADELYGPKPIIADIWASIWRARVLIADVTDRNPNVNYEIGLGDALGVPTVILSQRIEDVPFDYRHRRCVLYDTSRSRWQHKLTDDIIQNLLAVLEEADYQPPLPWPEEASPDSPSIPTTTVASGRSLKEVVKGAKAATGLVSRMYGPWGSAVSLRIGRERGTPRPMRRATKVLDSFFIKNPLEMHGVESARLVANRMADDAEDGTKLALLLFSGLLDRGSTLVLEETSHRKSILQHMDAAVEVARSELKARCTALQEDDVGVVIESATLGDTELTRVLQEAAMAVGTHGAVMIEEARGEETGLEPWKDMLFDQGWASSDFVTDQQENHCVLSDCRILIYRGKLEEIDKLVELMKSVRRDGQSLLCIATDFSETAINALVLARRYRHWICAIRAPGFGDRQLATLEDIAIRSGGELVYPGLQMSLEEVDQGILGKADCVIVRQDSTSVKGLGGSREAINRRIDQLTKELEKTISEYDKDKLIERLANLTGDSLILRVGGRSEDEISNRTARARSAWAACAHARRTGAVQGGGGALMRAYGAVTNEKHENDVARRAFQAVAWACANPVKILLENKRGGGSKDSDSTNEASELPLSQLAPTTLPDVQLLDSWFVVDCALRTSWAEARLLLDTTHWDVSPEPEDRMTRRLR